MKIEEIILLWQNCFLFEKKYIAIHIIKVFYFNFCRVLVPPTMVGAIIGKEGKKIKDLTEKTETE